MYNVSSRGSVHIKSANAIHSAEWDTGLFSNPEDLKNLVRVFRVGTEESTSHKQRQGQQTVYLARIATATCA
jgi:hypothetical protein